MRKILFYLSVSLTSMLFSSNMKVNAQTAYLGGEMSMIYVNRLDFGPIIRGGYEFNDKFAIEGLAGVEFMTNPRSTGLNFGASVRYTPWHNETTYLDLKFRTELVKYTGDYYIDGDIGFTFQPRFRIAPHWDVVVPIGLLGLRFIDGTAYPAIGFTSRTSVGILYRFK